MIKVVTEQTFDLLTDQKDQVELT